MAKQKEITIEGKISFWLFSLLLHVLHTASSPPARLLSVAFGAAPKRPGRDERPGSARGEK
eukprot:3032519-Heterocapsa_arctica.AAC.1